MAEQTTRFRAALSSLLLLFGLSCVFFLERPSWNQNSRFGLTRALVEHRSLQIDPWAASTGDLSRREGHAYCDKAPGVSVLATPAYGLYYLGLRLSGREPPTMEVVPLDPLDALGVEPVAPDAMRPGDRLAYDHAWRAGLWIARLGSVSLLSLLSLALFARWLRTRVEDRIALWTSAIWAFATPAFCYAVGFYGHQAAAAAVLIALCLVDRPSNASLLSPRLEPFESWIAGASLGLGVCCEYPLAVPAALLWAWSFRRRGRAFALRMAGAGAPFALALALYHQLAFGHPLATGYDFLARPEFAEGMEQAYGIAAPDLQVAINLLFGSYRGLFFLSPVLLLAAWGLGWLCLSQPRPDLGEPTLGELSSGERALIPAARLGALIFLFYWALNAGYWMWDGGASWGPRHLVPALPFLSLGLVVAIPRLPRATAWLAAGSCALSVLGAAVAPEAPDYGNPVFQYAVPEFLFGSAPSPHAGGGARHLGELLGLGLRWGLVPLFALAGLLFPWDMLRPEDSGQDDKRLPSS